MLGQHAAFLRDRSFDNRLAHRRAVLLARRLVGAVAQGLEGGNQMVFAVAHQVGAAHGFERFTQQRPVVGVVVAQKGFVQAPALFAALEILLAPDV